VIGTDHVLARIDVVARGIVEIEIARDAADRMIEVIIGFGIIGIIGRREILPIEIVAAIGQVPVADLALDRQRRLDEAVAAIFGWTSRSPTLGS
jgi:hypothetical protein